MSFDDGTDSIASVTSYPESYIILAVLLCLVPIVLYGNYKIGRAFERGARNS